MFTTEIAVADDAFWCILSFFLILEIHFSQNCPSFSILFFLNNSIDCNKSYHPFHCTNLFLPITTKIERIVLIKIIKTFILSVPIPMKSNISGNFCRNREKNRSRHHFHPSIVPATSQIIRFKLLERDRAHVQFGFQCFIREMVYAAYSAHVNPFESAIAAEFGFKNLRKFVRPSDRNFIAATIPPGGNSMDPWEKKKRKKMPGRWNTRINERAEARRLRRQIVSRAQSTYGRDAADGTRDTRVRSSRRRKWTGRGGLVGVARATGTQRKRGRSVWPLD